MFQCRKCGSGEEKKNWSCLCSSWPKSWERRIKNDAELREERKLLLILWIFSHLELKTRVNLNAASGSCLLLSDKCPLLAKAFNVTPFFVQSKWFSDIFHVVTFRRYKTWAIAQIIEEAIVFLTRGQVENLVHPLNAKWVSILLETFKRKISFFKLLFHWRQFCQGILQCSNMLILGKMCVICLLLVLTG